MHEDMSGEVTGLPLLGRNLTISKSQLEAANEESIRLGFNRTLENLDTLPDQVFVIYEARGHQGYNGSDHNNRNVRLMVLLTTKHFNDPTLTEADFQPAFLDVTGDTFASIQKSHKRRKARLWRKLRNRGG